MNSDVLQRWLKEHRALALVQAPDSISPTTDIALSPEIILQS
jgi:hypothetical protein